MNCLTLSEVLTWRALSPSRSNSARCAMGVSAGEESRAAALLNSGARFFSTSDKSADYARLDASCLVQISSPWHFR